MIYLVAFTWTWIFKQYSSTLIEVSDIADSELYEINSSQSYWYCRVVHMLVDFMKYLQKLQSFWCPVLKIQVECVSFLIIIIFVHNQFLWQENIEGNTENLSPLDAVSVFLHYHCVIANSFSWLLHILINSLMQPN